MKGLVISLLGLAVIAALFAGIHYSQDPVQVREEVRPAYVIAPGEVRTASIQPSLADSPILVELTVAGGPIDLYVMDPEWAAARAKGGTVSLDGPFTYHAQWSRVNITGEAEVVIVSDGRSSLALVLDNSDNFYDGDAEPAGDVTVRLAVRFVEQEGRSLVLAYLAAVPSILLVTVTAVRKVRRLRPPA